MIRSQYKTAHSFHVPVLGIGFSVDMPLKVAHLGIDSVISLADDQLLERLRKKYCETYQLPHEEISSDILDYRAKRITAYLNLIHALVQDKVASTTAENQSGLGYYLNKLPLTSKLRSKLTRNGAPEVESINWLKNNLPVGSIDVNIMTKVDKENTHNKEALPSEYNDAHAAVRGFANSVLQSSLVLSAGMNPRLYSYLANFDDFYPEKDGTIKKKIVLKVSDFRSAQIQGKFLAKKGIWVSEYRIESGLNCGGHAFATNGLLLGPIMEEFKTKRETLRQETFSLLTQTLAQLDRPVPTDLLNLHITAQGGVGTSEEHDLLLDHYNMDSVGWGSPFLLVPEVTNVDEDTVKLLERATEKDLYLSGASPLGVPFNNLRGNSKDSERKNYIQKGRPGSACPKKFLALNKEFSDKGMCTASRQYQVLKLKALDEKQLPQDQHKAAYDQIVEKSCICVGLGTSALLTNKMDTKKEKEGVSICPGPNTAYFSKAVSLDAMIGHIYGRENIIERTDRPHMFVKEFSLYIDYLKNQIEETKQNLSKQGVNYLKTFSANLKESSDYYTGLLKQKQDAFKATHSRMKDDFTQLSLTLQGLQMQVAELKIG